MRIKGEVVPVPIAEIQLGGSPRLNGEDELHIMRLAETAAALPPIVVHRQSMQVIDGSHRLRAALLNGRETIDAVFFDGSDVDAFLCAVEANVTHGLPLTQADRRAAAERIVASHPQLSDRAIAHSTGLAPRSVAEIREQAGTGSQPDMRVGRDGKVRPLRSTEGRERAATLISENPKASLREVARQAGISPATVADVRRRLERGQSPATARETGHDEAGAARPNPSVDPEAVQTRLSPALEKLLRDPSLRHTEVGRRFLRQLQQNTAAIKELTDAVRALPPHCAVLVAQYGRQCSEIWNRLALELQDGLKQGQH